MGYYEALAAKDKRVESGRLAKKAAKKEIDLATVKAVDNYIKHKQWAASKLAPQQFGNDKQMVSITNGDGQKLEIEWQK